ncbi:Mif2p Ecym_2433 [Eremothecium cymbalariae DBVPG|uniref:CENP-C homolog n=1 Tax=Eremothecium cymbalariae (strain CBS 270.75 / DBVPG 7215 / KCTC 17166 / NRRL Y-17582) TaxID=931890 RepID=G8JPA5_ERECY|nr:Hypothetical protein Ecym_2433 [Eremothecium cymbalariae DBVPG\
MDYMNLGITSRKTGLRVKQTINKDEYSMENIDEFFADDDDSTIGSRRRSRRTSLLGNLKQLPVPSLPAQMFMDEDGFRIPSSAPQVRKQFLPSGQRTPTDTQYDDFSIPQQVDGSFLSPIQDFPGDEIPTEQVPQKKRKERPHGTTYTTNYEVPNEVEHGGNDSTIMLTPNARAIDDYRDVPDLVDDNETTRDNTSFNTSDNALLEDEMDDDFEFQSAEEEDREYVDSVSRRGSSSSSSSESSGEEKNDSDPDSADDDAALSRRDKNNKMYYDNESSSSDVLDSDDEYIQQQAKDLLTADDHMVGSMRRSKRVRVPPLEYWRNEKVVYKRKSDKPILEIDKIITYDHEADEEDAKLSRKKTNTKTKARPYNYIPTGRPRGRPKKNATAQNLLNQDPNQPIKAKIESGDLENSEWLKHGILQSNVNVSTDKKGNEIVAFAPGLAQSEQPKETEYENFTLAVMFDKHRELFASGTLVLPVEGRKESSDSFNAFITFYVIQGIVEILLSENKFICTEGSSFQVPAFNSYAFVNIGRNEAKMFFVQVTVPEDFDGSDNKTRESSSPTLGSSSSNMSLTSP